MEVKAAHGGAKLHCVCVGPDGMLYTGGDDTVSGSSGVCRLFLSLSLSLSLSVSLSMEMTGYTP